jgi:hypothetical protein
MNSNLNALTAKIFLLHSDKWHWTDTICQFCQSGLVADRHCGTQSLRHPVIRGQLDCYFFRDSDSTCQWQVKQRQWFKQLVTRVRQTNHFLQLPQKRLTFWSLVVFFRTTTVNIKKFYMALTLRWVFCTDIRTDSEFCLYSINWLAFITEMKSVYCAVRTGSFK